MGGGDKTNQSITPIPVLLFLARERERKKEGGKKEKRRASLLEEIRLGAE